MKQTSLDVEWVAAHELFLSPSNPRHNDPAVVHVAASIKRFGWQQPIVAKPSGEVIAGNTRLKAAEHLGMTQVPVVRFTGSELEALAYSIADNKTHEFSSWDEPALANILEELRAEDALDGVGFSTEEIDNLLAELEEEDAALGDVDDQGAEEPPEKAATRPGDLW